MSSASPSLKVQSTTIGCTAAPEGWGREAGAWTIHDDWRGGVQGTGKLRRISSQGQGSAWPRHTCSPPSSTVACVAYPGYERTYVQTCCGGAACKAPTACAALELLQPASASAPPRAPNPTHPNPPPIPSKYTRTHHHITQTSAHT